MFQLVNLNLPYFFPKFNHVERWKCKKILATTSIVFVQIKFDCKFL